MALLAGSLVELKGLLQLTKVYCDKYQVKLVASKTKLLVYSTKHTKVQSLVELWLWVGGISRYLVLPRREFSVNT